MSNMADIGVITFNVRGIRQQVKRRALFQYFHRHFPKHIIVLQETHSSQKDLRYWRAEWGSDIFCAHGRNTNECGVAILLPRSFNGNIIQQDTDTEGRLVALEIELQEFIVTLIGIYAPTQRHERTQLQFYESLASRLCCLAPDRMGYVIVCGDCNVHLGQMDTDNKRHFKMTHPAKMLSDILSEFMLNDIWRMRNPISARYTWRRMVPLQQSRIDYIFVSQNIVTKHIISQINIKSGILSDHSIVHCTLTLFPSERGPGLFSFNHAVLLQDEEFVAGARKEIDSAVSGCGMYSEVVDKGLRLEMLSSQIRVSSIKRGKAVAARAREKEKLALSSLLACEQRMAEDPDDDIVAEYIELKNEVDTIEEAKGKKAILRSGARWTELGEKPTRYFLNMCAKKRKEKDINVLTTTDGTVIKGNREILQHCRDHFETIYKAKDGVYSYVAEAEARAFPHTCPQLSEEDQAACEGKMTNEECKKALAAMLNNKAPSVSGFSKEFYLFFWDEMGQFIVDYINESWQLGRFFITQRRGILVLIPKTGDAKLLKNKRPICLLDVVYKIAAKVLATRLSKVIDKLVARDQTGGIRGRYIGENIRTIADVIQYCKEDDLEGIMMALDFRNAYNTVEYSFLYTTLRKFNFGVDFMQWIKLLHTETEVAISNNGFTSSWFKPSRGLQQGSPISGLLFALVVEILAISIRSAENVRGIMISGCDIRLTQYCDDMTTFVADEESAAAVISMVNTFGEASGLELNHQKSHFMRLGKLRETSGPICGFDTVDIVKILGVRFSAKKNCRKENTEPVIDKIKRTLNIWNQRDLTLKGAITVAKSLAISQLTYLMTCGQVEQADLAVVQSLIMKFIWRGRPPKVAKKILTQGIDEGGLKAPDIFLSCRAIGASWVKRMITANHAGFVKILKARIRPLFLEDMLKMNYDKRSVDTLPIHEFYRHALMQFREIFPVTEPRSGKEVRAQIIWHNKVITVDGKPIFYRNLYAGGVKFIDDLTDESGRLLSFRTFNDNNPNIRVNYVTYLGLCTAIPGQWKVLARDGGEPLTGEERNEPANISYKGKRLTIPQVSCKHMYNIMLPSNTPTAQIRWVQEDIDVGDDWESIYRLPFQITCSTRLQTLQYKIIHRFFPTRKYLYTRQVIDDPFCDECGLVESIEHCFFECHRVRVFWTELFRKLNLKLSGRSRVDLTLSSVLFGVPGKLAVVNLIILAGRQCIANQRHRESNLTYAGFYAILGKIFDVDKEIAVKNEKLLQFSKKWEPFVSADVTLSYMK